MKLVAITHAPSPRMDSAVRTFVDVTPIDLGRVALQHAAYCDALTRAGAQVTRLEANADAPDAVFVEDTAVVLDELAILASMGAPSRRGEIAGIEPELRRHREEVTRIVLPATLEGGDVLRVGRDLFVGTTKRTNRAGFDALARLAGRHGYAVRNVGVEGCLHLKSGCTALPDGTLLVQPRWIAEGDLDDAPILHVAEDELGAANVVLVGERVLMSAAYPRTIELVRARGFDVEAIELDELAKADGSATCLSILVPSPFGAPGG